MAPTPTLRGASGAVQDRMIGRILGGRYRVLSRLGEGGMGTVYLCEHAVLGRRYAVKVLRAELCSDAELGERFRNEAIAASRIGGDNVVDVLDFGAEGDGALYYVMEALDGRSLGTILAEEGPMEVGRVLDLLEQTCRALGAAHARGVIHRDVKPDNVFVVRRPDGTEQAKVIDFGISQVMPPEGKDRITIAGSIIGTPEYMAPEQASGEPIDERADVYALGVLAYELLTGTLPIVALTPVATLVAHQTLAPIPPSRRRPGIPVEVDVLVLRALAKRPQDRPQSMAEFAAAIAAIRRSRQTLPGTGPLPPRARETVSLPESAVRRVTRERSRRRWAVAGVVGAIVAVAAGGIAWRFTSSSSSTATATPTPTATATSTSTPTATATSTSTPTPTTSTSTDATAASDDAPAPAKPASRPARVRAAARAKATPKAPDESDVRSLKDPYR